MAEVYRWLKQASFYREIILGEWTGLIDLHKENLRSDVLQERLQRFTTALREDNMIIDENTVGVAVDFAREISQEIGEKFSSSELQKDAKNKGYDLAAKLYLQVLDFANNERLMTKFKTGVSGQVVEPPQLN